MKFVKRLTFDDSVKELEFETETKWKGITDMVKAYKSFICEHIANHLPPVFKLQLHAEVDFISTVNEGRTKIWHAMTYPSNVYELEKWLVESANEIDSKIFDYAYKTPWALEGSNMLVVTVLDYTDTVDTLDINSLSLVD
jgi:hypothetical protein